MFFSHSSMPSFQKHINDSVSMDQSLDIDVKKIFSKPESTTNNRYIYKFVSAKESGLSELRLTYLAETNKHMQSLSQKHCDLDMSQIQSIIKLNSQLTNINKWFLGHIHNPLYSIITELSYSKCQFLIEEATVKSLKDPNKLSRIFTKIESSKHYSNIV